MNTWMIVALIGMVIIVYTRLFVKQEPQQNSASILESVEDTLEHFVLEVEEENKQMIDQVRTVRAQFEEQNSKLLSRIEFLEKQLLTRTMNNQQAAEAVYIKNDGNQSKPSVVNAVEEESAPKPKVMAIKERYSQLFQLHDAGKSVDYIAKKLKINKGEVQLIMQLGIQEEQSRV